jgi:hypothetical protein
MESATTKRKGGDMGSLYARAAPATPKKQATGILDAQAESSVCVHSPGTSRGSPDETVNMLRCLPTQYKNKTIIKKTTISAMRTAILRRNGPALELLVGAIIDESIFSTQLYPEIASSNGTDLLALAVANSHVDMAKSLLLICPEAWINHVTTGVSEEHFYGREIVYNQTSSGSIQHTPLSLAFQMRGPRSLEMVKILLAAGGKLTQNAFFFLSTIENAPFIQVLIQQTVMEVVKNERLLPGLHDALAGAFNERINAKPLIGIVAEYWMEELENDWDDFVWKHLILRKGNRISQY